MRHRTAALIPFASLLLAAGPAPAPDPADVPHPGPVSVGLAGQGELDLTRFFLASGPTDFTVSPDGKLVAWLSSPTSSTTTARSSPCASSCRQSDQGSAVTCATPGESASAAAWLSDSFASVSPRR